MITPSTLNLQWSPEERSLASARSVHVGVRRARILYGGVRKNRLIVETGQAPAKRVIITYPARVHRPTLPLPLARRSTPDLFDEGVD